MILYKFCLFIVDWNLNPVDLSLENDLPTGDVVCWFYTSLPGHHLGPPHTLVKALCQLVNQREAMLRQQVHALIVNPPENLLNA